MLRICLCLLIALTSADVASREVKMSSPNSGSCPDSIADKEQPARATVRKAPPARETRVKPTLSNDAGIGNGRLQSPRWHSYLPGMFR
jgi:hypothetical protein